MLPDEATCRKDMKAIKMRVEDYPTYLWLLRFKPKSTVTMTAVAMILAFIVITSLVDRGLLAALATWVGVPSEVIRSLGGG